MKKFNILYVILATAALSIYATNSYNSSQNQKTEESANKEVQGKNEIPEVDSEQKVTCPPLPEKMTFAGQNIPMDGIDFKERLDKEIIVNMFRHSHTLLFLKKSKMYFSIIEPILKKNGLPDDFKYLAVIESGLENVVSPAGAAGVWQFMKPTAKNFDMEVDKFVDERYHLEKSTEAACEFLKRLHRVYDDWFLAAAAYNRGQGGISEAMEEQGVNSYFDLYLNSETARYVFRMLAVKLIMENPEKYGFYIADDQYYQLPDSKEIKVAETIDDLKIFAKEQGTNYKSLKLLNPWIRSSKLPKGNKPYTIKIPIKD
ncbi:MAG: transglycosylase SLT domain-containing protein [Crocinitomicaceae bacterium]|nr:transglycosylase SLT domain-containing protein [Crocinitomicaceae bacterium]